MHRFRSLTLLISAMAMTLSACSITSPSEPATTTSSVTSTPGFDLVLLNNGLGPFDFGDDSEVVINGVTASIGGWDVDSRETDIGTTPTCATGQARLVLWGSLVLTFVQRDGAESFTGWAYGFDPLTGNTDDNRHLGLRTPEGIQLGSVRGDLIDAYGSRVSIIDDTALDTAAFIVGGTSPTELAGKLDGAGPGASVNFLETTPNC